MVELLSHVHDDAIKFASWLVESVVFPLYLHLEYLGSAISSIPRYKTYGWTVLEYIRSINTRNVSHRLSLNIHTPAQN